MLEAHVLSPGVPAQGINDERARTARYEVDDGVAVCSHKLGDQFSPRPKLSLFALFYIHTAPSVRFTASKSVRNKG
jgi:hypothetical protein